MPAGRLVKTEKRCCKSRPRCKRCPVVCKRLAQQGLADAARQAPLRRRPSTSPRSASRPPAPEGRRAADRRRRYPAARMATCLVTGGAGFLGSHLCDELLRRGHRVICVDNLETGSLANIEHIRVPEFTHPPRGHHRAVLRRRAGRLRLPPRVAGVADRLPAAAAAHAQGRLLRHPPHARAGQAAPRALPDRLDQRGLRRPAGASAARDLLGPRQPDRPARRLRRGQALRRGADDGLPPPAGRGHGDRADLQHLRPADAPARRARDPDVPAPGAAGPADHGVRRRLADALLLLRRPT